MLKSSKPNRCKHCKVRMPEDKARHVLHDECKDAWIADYRKKQDKKKAREQRAKAKVERAETRRRKEKSLTISQRRARAQVEVNAYVRLRDAGLPCISCGRHHEGQWHAGHYRSRGAAVNLALDPRNIHRQCAPCNNHLHGNAIGYRAGLVARYGLEFVEALEADNAPRHQTAQEIDAIRDTYRTKNKELKKETTC